MTKPISIIALLLAGSLFIIAPLQASDHGKKQCDGKMMQMFKKLDLTDKQHDAIKMIKEKMHAEKMAHKHDMMPIRKAMRKQIEADKLDLSEIRNLAHQKALLVERMTVTKAQYMHEIHQHLTAEQREKLGKMKDEKMKKMHGKHAGH